MEVIKIVKKDNSTASNDLYEVEVEKKRVAAYARVSTELDEQQSSYEAQVNYYTNYIKSRPEWEFVKVYSDEGITGTSTKHREGFNRMMEDALAGRIDLILTKSISRFARNTVDTLTAIRELKEKNVEVYFEKENIYSLDTKGEIMLTIMSSLAQEESRSISENITWSVRKRMENGKVYIPPRLMGYHTDEDGNILIVEKEAAIIREIYERYISGDSCFKIAKSLMDRGIKSPGGVKTWHRNTIYSILSNEKYKGDALLQKTYTPNFLTKETKKNDGALPQYYVKNSHPAIIDEITFAKAQSERERRAGTKANSYSDSPFSGRIICADCGSVYGRRVTHADPRFRHIAWGCVHKYRKGHYRCHTPNIREEVIMKAFVIAANNILTAKKAHIEMLQEKLTTFPTDDEIRDRFIKAQEDYHAAEELYEEALKKQTYQESTNEESVRRIDALEKAYEKKYKDFLRLKDRLNGPNLEACKIQDFINYLESAPDKLDEFSEAVCKRMMESAIADNAGNLTFQFYDGTNIKVNIKELKP